MINKLRSLDDLAVARILSNDSWIWQDDMITFPDDGFYDIDESHPICGEFPEDSVIAPRGIWND